VQRLSKGTKSDFELQGWEQELTFRNLVHDRSNVLTTSFPGGFVALLAFDGYAHFEF
jgi:hypothetical protein